MKTITTGIALLVSVVTTAQTTAWQPFTLNNEIQISAPGRWDSSKIKDVMLYSHRLADSTANFSVLERSLSGLGLSPEDLDAKALTKEFWDQYEQGFISTQTNLNVVKSEDRRVGGLLGRVLVYTRSGKDDLLTQLFVLRGTRLYLITHNSRKGKGDAKLKDEFFANVKPL